MFYQKSAFSRLPGAHLAIYLLCIVAVIPSTAQVVNENNTGFPENAILHGGAVDTVQAQNGNLHIQIPVWSTKGRGIDTGYMFEYDSKTWEVDTYCDDSGYCSAFVQGGGPIALTPTFDCCGVSGSEQLQVCDLGWETLDALEEIGTTINEPDGTKHHMLPDPYAAGPATACTSYLGLPANVTSLYADDGSGWVATVDPNSGGITILTRKDGTQFGANIEDSNGNQIQITQIPSPPYKQYTDTLGRAVNTDGSYYDSSGTLRSLTITTTTVQIATQMCGFADPTIYVQSCSEYNGTKTVPWTIRLPNNMSYTFQYNSYNSSSGGGGEPTSMTLPTGGSITWTWGGWDRAGRGVTSRTVSSGSVSGTWYFSDAAGEPTTVTVTDPTGAKVVYTGGYFSGGPGPNAVGPFLPTQEQYQDASGNTLKTVTHDYTSYKYSNGYTFVPIRDTTTWNQQNLVSKVETDWDTISVPDFNGGTGTVTWKNPVAVREYDWGNGGPGPLLRNTTYDYLHLDNGNYLQRNIADRVTAQYVYDGVGNLAAATTNSYDQIAVWADSGGAPSHDSNFGTGNNIRGNLNYENHWLNTTGGWLTTTKYYDDLGNLRQKNDPGGHPTSFYYDDNWTGTGCVPGGVNTQAYLTKVVNALGHNKLTSYSPCPGLVQSVKDQNDINAGRNGTAYTYDLMLRPLSASYADGGITTYNYHADVLPYTVSTTRAANPNPDVTNSVVYDGLGRVSQTSLDSDPEGADLTLITYDSVGRVYSVSNPYRNGVSSPTDGTTYYAYDPFDRRTQMTRQDGNTVITNYAGNVTTTTDETGRSQQTVSDALGRLTEVIEPNPNSGSLTNGSYPTYYSYDALGDITYVNQVGDGTAPRNRSFHYDSVSRLLSAYHPETGWICYGTQNLSNNPPCNNDGYDADGNLLYKTDGRGKTVQFHYDALRRITWKGGDPGTAWVGYSYDQGTDWGFTLNNPIGRLTSEAAYFPNQPYYAASDYSYDAMGRVAVQYLCVPSTCTTPTYRATAQYDVSGHLTSLTYPSGRKITESYNAAGSLLNVKFDSLNGTAVNYAYLAMPQSTSGSGWGYHPNGAPHLTDLGNGVQETSVLNNRLQINQLEAASTQTWFNKSYTLYDCCGHNNGNILTISDNLNANRTQQYGYDYLNRITMGLQNDGAFNQTFSVDPWGNLKQFGTSAFSPNFDANNRISQTGYNYDLAGNLLSDTFHSYAYDAESRIKTVDSSVTYTYDADGNRVRKDVGSDATEYIYFNGRVIAEYKPATGRWSDYIFANGQRIARSESGISIAVRFTNDSCSGCGGTPVGGGDRNLYVNSITVGSTTISPSDPSVSYTSYPCNSTQGSQAVILCNGDMISSTFATGSNITVNAYGSPDYNIYPHMQVWINGSLAGEWNVTGSAQSYTAILPGSASSGNVHYYIADHLGTARMEIDTNNEVISDCTYAPFGEQANCSVSDPNNHYKFTGKERDSESNLDYFGARHMSSPMGRFTAPDPSVLSVLPKNPQTWNRYGYVYNNPFSFRDDNGKWPTKIHEQIIDNAFPNLTPAQRQILKNVSAEQDSIWLGGQSNDNSYQHEMRSPDQTVDEAQTQFNDYVWTQEAIANNLQIDFSDPETRSTTLTPEALTEFGRALHAVVDATSPAHAGFQKWDWRNPRLVWQHHFAENHINDQQMRTAVNAARSAFVQAFGGFGFSVGGNEPLVTTTECDTLPNGITRCYHPQ